MHEAIAWLNVNNGSVQAVSTVVLVVVTAWYSAKMARLTAAATEPKVRVTLRWGFHTPGGLDVLILTATNTGQMPVKVTQPFLKLPDGRQTFTFSFDYVDTPRDSKLYAGDTASYHLSRLVRSGEVFLTKVTKTIRAFAPDSTINSETPI